MPSKSSSELINNKLNITKKQPVVVGNDYALMDNLGSRGSTQVHEVTNGPDFLRALRAHNVHYRHSAATGKDWGREQHAPESYK
jgi:hypothetical protein